MARPSPADTLPEATWGADPLEFDGGFRNMKYDEHAKFSSSLTPNAKVAWSRVDAKSVTCQASAAHSTLSVSFPDIDWSSLQSIYGWAALQYQAWARGSLEVSGDEPQTVVLFTEGLLEFYVDGARHFGGDAYHYKRAPLVLHLDPGHHVLDLRLVRDLRAMGGVGAPTIDIHLSAELSSQDLRLAADAPLLPDMVDGKLAGALGSMLVRNDATYDMDIVSVSTNDDSYAVWLLHPERLRIASGQTRPVAFGIQCIGIGDCSPNVRLDIGYEDFGSRPTKSVLHVHHKMNQRKIHEPHKITFLHPGGMVSYAALRPPSTNISCPNHAENSLPVLLQLHGAGVDADSDFVKHTLDPLPDLCAFVLYPTGSTLWSGDDWHAWGFADVQAAVDALPAWVSLTGWQGQGVDTSRWFVSGHSNGGKSRFMYVTVYC